VGSVKEQVAVFEGGRRMSVISRLDDQVNEILITPLQRKNNQEANVQEVVQPSPCETTQVEPDSSEKKRAERETLPVWLL
jgi:hypothetical protein